MEGTRPLLIELQALTSQTIFGMPRRTSIGIDYNRLTVLSAVLEKKVGAMLSNQDCMWFLRQTPRHNQVKLIGHHTTSRSSFVL